MIFIPSKKFIDLELPTLKVGVEGFYTLQAIRSGKVLRELSFKNLITDLGLDRMGSLFTTDLYGRCQVGTGNTVPAVTDTSLANYLGGFANLGTGTPSNSGSSPYYGQTVYNYQSAIGALGTNNLTEIGVSGQTTTGNLYSRSLIVDGVGNPTSFPINSSEQLNAAYTLRTYVPLVDITGTANINATPYNITYRAFSATSTIWAPPIISTSFQFFDPLDIISQQVSSTPLQPITNTNLTGHLGYSTSAVTQAYGTGNLYRDCTITFGTSTGNGSIKKFLIQLGRCQFQVELDNPLVKANTQILTVNFRVAWGRYP